MTRFGKASLLVIPAMAATLLAPLPTRSSAAPRTGCQNLPISYTFLSTTAAPAAIWNDDPNQPYEGGINRCGSNPTNDATMALGHSKTRYVWIQVPAPFPNSNIVSPPPSFAGGAAFQSKAFFNVRNLLGSTDPYFYTSMASQFPAPDGNIHHLRLMPDAWACPGDLICVPNIHGGILADSNLPVETSWVRVHYMPPPNPTQPWSLSNTAHWIVDGELADTVYPSLYERATLHNDGRSGGGGTHEGQYSMPLQILITALGPL